MDNRSFLKTAPGIGVFSVTQSDGNDLDEPARVLWVAADGELHCVFEDGSEDTLPCFAGEFPFSVKKIFETGTTLTDSQIFGVR